MIRTREEAIKQCEEFIKYHSDWSVEIEWANGVEFVLEDYKRLIEQEPKIISKEKAIEILKADSIASYSGDEIISARNMAIKALEQESTYISQIAQKAYEDGKKDGYVQAKLEQEPTTDEEYEYVYTGNGAYEKRLKVKSEPTTKNDLGVDREQLKNMIRGLTKWYVKRDNAEVGQPNTAVGLLYDDVMFGIDRLPSVTPQEPCDKCEVGNPCLYCKHEFEPHEREE